MRRVLPVILLAVLALPFTVGCSRQPQPHVGEWDAQWFLVGDIPLASGTWYFSPDGTLQSIYEKPPAAPVVSNGKYKFDYSKNPIQLDITWTDNLSIQGIAQFVGENKNRMQIIYSNYTPTRPTTFDAKEPFFWLTKKLKK